jgi:short-subunit dehydrogenase
MSANALPVALVTGTSTGIGLESAVALAKAGFTVVATMRDLARSSALRQAADESGVALDLRELDVTNDGQCQALVAEVLADHLVIDVLVNNAGVGFVGTLEQVSLDDLAATMATNFTSVARLTKLVLPGQRERGSGRILTVTSVGGVVGQPFNDAYCAAKFAVEGLLESLAPVARAHGVSVSVIEPGPVSTAFVDNVTPSLIKRPSADDDPYASEFAGYLSRVMASFADAQTAVEVADVVVQAAVDPNPRFRYQTSAVARAFVGTKIGDLDGSSVLAMTEEWVRQTS